MLVTLSVSAFAQATGGQIGSTAPRDGQISSTKSTPEHCVLANGQIGSTVNTPQPPTAAASDGQIGSTKTAALPAAGTFESFTEFIDRLGIRVFFNF